MKDSLSKADCRLQSFYVCKSNKSANTDMYGTHTVSVTPIMIGNPHNEEILNSVLLLDLLE